MPVVRGRVTRFLTTEEEGRTDWALAISKILWIGICLLFPFSIFRFLNDFFGIIIASTGILLVLLLVRLSGPLNLIMLDELLARIFPSLRSAVRTGRVLVRDFRVEPLDSREVTCILRGDLRGGAPMLGDSVILEGAYRYGALRVRRGQNQATGALIVPVSSHSGWVLLVTFAIVTLFALYLLGAFDQWLYPLLGNWVARILEKLKLSAC